MGKGQRINEIGMSELWTHLKTEKPEKMRKCHSLLMSKLIRINSFLSVKTRLRW